MYASAYGDVLGLLDRRVHSSHAEGLGPEVFLTAWHASTTCFLTPVGPGHRCSAWRATRSGTPVAAPRGDRTTRRGDTRTVGSALLLTLRPAPRLSKWIVYRARS